MTSNEPPEDIMEAVKLIREADTRSYLTRTDKENLNRAKLRIAFWACRAEGIMASRENLAYVLGPDATEIMGNYDRYLERVDEKGKVKPRDDNKPGGRNGASGFWESV